MYLIQTCFNCHPSDSTFSEDAGIKPRTVATLALTARLSNYSARSHPEIYILPYYKVFQDLKFDYILADNGEFFLLKAAEKGKNLTLAIKVVKNKSKEE
jgi:hypothetical protein